MKKAAAAGAVVVVVLLLWSFDPRTAGFFPPCPWFTLTGLQCPGCGTTRALHALVHGDVAAALALNPFTMTLGILVMLKLATPPLPRSTYAPIAVGIMAVAVIFGVVRNLA